MKKLLSTVLVASMILSATACSSNNSDNKETTITGETKTTVNPDVSEPNQSIASGALIPDQTTETTTETPSGNNTYNLRGKDFTLSVHLEDYIYRLDGSDYEYFNIEELMNQYGYSQEDNFEFMCYHYVYGNDDIWISYDWQSAYPDGSNLESGNPIVGMVHWGYRTASYDGHGGVRELTGAGNTDRVFEVNGIIYEGKPVSRYCLTWEQIVLSCVVIEDFAKNGTTVAAYDSICTVYESGGGAGHGSAIRLNK